MKGIDKGIPDRVWIRREGRNSEGCRYGTECLVEKDGRIVAKVADPDDEYYDYRAYFFLGPDYDKEDSRFIDRKAAMVFAERIVERARKAASRRKSPTARARSNRPA